MDLPSSRTGYKSVNHQEDTTSDMEDHSYPDEKRMTEPDSRYTDGHHTPEIHLSTPANNKSRTIWQKCNSFWVWELTACAISLACLGIVLRTLFWLDDQPRTRWTYQIEPAAFISIFVTISRFMMLVGVAEGLGQLRWLYYLGGSRRLDHLDSFDSASRGPWGSLLFTFRISINGMVPTIARFGALLMIVALAMDPFAQQILRTDLADMENSNDSGAWLLFTNTSSATSKSIFADVSRRRSIYGGLLGISDNMPFGCSSGNCTWQPFTSLGYAIPCRDVASEAQRTCATGSGTLGVNCTAIQYLIPRSNLSMTLYNGSISQTPSNVGLKQFTFLKSVTSGSFPGGYKSPTLFSFFIAQLLITRPNDTYNVADLANPAWNLTVCDANWGAKLYENLRVYKGAYIDTPSRDLDLVPVQSSTCWNTQPPTCQEFTLSNISANPKGSSPNFRMEIDTTPVNIREFLQLDNNFTLSSSTTDVSGTYGSYNLATGLFWNVNITDVFQNLEVSLTNFLRENSNPQHVNGTVTNNVVTMRVRWRWFALPAAVDLLGPAFLIWVIVYTAMGVKGERLIWKSNTIPLLMHGLEGYHHHGYAGAETTGAIFHKAREMRVQLRRNQDGEIRFVRT